MSRSKSPPTPDFGGVDETSAGTVERRAKVLELVGNLVFNWSNNESLFIFVLMLLLETDEETASLVFATLNTTRARLDLIDRLAKLKIKDAALNRELSHLIARFNATTLVRNELTHSMYIVDQTGEIVHTQTMRVVQTRASLGFGEARPVDEARIKAIKQTIKNMVQINRDIWAFLPRLQAHLHP